MNNFIIKNSAESSTTEIDIFGDIGESWWGESVDFKDVKESLEGITSSNIKLNISTYGGDVNHAFSIYNLLKTHPAKIEANIMGFTASAGTIIALAADTVVMDENTMFLVHNAWTGLMGNQHELREAADNLEKIDNRLIAIYKTKTGKRKDSIHNLMKEEKWLDSSEAKEWGFVDEVYAPMKAAASIEKDIKYINSSKTLPKIVNKSNINMSTIKEELEGFKDEMMNDIKAIFKANKQEVSEDELNSKVDEAIKAKSEALELKNSELIGNKVTEFEAKTVELTEKFDAEKLELQNSVEALTKEVNELKGTETVVTPVATVEDPTDEPREKTQGEEILANIFNGFSAVDKLNASVK